MRLVDDHQVPLRTEEVIADVVTLGEVDARDHHRVAVPRAPPELMAHLLAADDLKLLVELLEHLVLPLRRQRRRRKDQAPIHDPAQLQLLQQQPGHDRLARARIVGEHEPQPWLREHVPVDRLDLVRQSPYPAHRHREQRVMGKRELDAVTLDPPEQIPSIGLRRYRSLRGESGLQLLAGDLCLVRMP